jgi:hypothetical protein
MKTEVANGMVQITARKRVETNEGRTISWHDDGIKVGHVSLQIDLDVLLRDLGARAMKAKGGRAQLAHGAIVAVVNKSSITHHRKGG